jgi:hypothetical protein
MKKKKKIFKEKNAKKTYKTKKYICTANTTEKTVNKTDPREEAPRQKKSQPS